MQVTVGITEKRMTANPLGLEAEMTVGDDQTNPYRSVAEKEEVERIEDKQRQAQDDQLFVTSFGASDTGGVDSPLESNSTVVDPTADPDPFVFDDLGLATFDLPKFDTEQPEFNLLDDGPQF
jgi:hypothetical protein